MSGNEKLRKRGLAALIGVMLITSLGACSRSAGGGRGVTATTINRVSTTVPSVAPSTLSADRAVVALFAIRNDAWRNNPDPDRVDHYMSAGSSDYKTEKSDLQELQTKHERLASNVFEIEGLRITRNEGVYVTAVIVGGRPELTVIDSNDIPVRKYGDELHSRAFFVSIINVKGEWKIVSLTSANIKPEMIESVRKAGIPS